MSTQDDVFGVDDRFFAALLAADGGALDELLVEDFVIVDVLSGSVADKSDLVPVVASAALAFDEIERDVDDRQVRLHDSTAIVVGRTQMRGHYEGQPWSAASRYIHVFTRAFNVNGWRMASAQGTPIVGPAG
jgi:ketosteroid isomerase-like protein